MAFQRATAVTPLTATTYAVNLSDDWCIGSVPNGGYVASVLLTAVKAHFASTLAHLGQPDSLSLQLQYLRRTHAGPGVVTLEHLKLGRSLSTVQVVLAQAGRRQVQGFVVQTSFAAQAAQAAQAGLSLPTSWLQSSLATQPPPPIDFAAVARAGEDAHWIADPAARTAADGFRRATRHVLFCHPKPGLAADKSIVDQWMRFRPGGPGHAVVPWPQEALGFVVDVFPQLVEAFSSGGSASGSGPGVSTTRRWYPTVALNLDVKRQLDPEAAEWLFLRVRAGEIRHGRFDLQVLVLDRGGRLIAISSHIALILSSERNLAPRQGTAEAGDSGGTGGKL